MKIWNWKTAVCSGLYRGPAFFVVSARLGLDEALRAGGTEFAIFATMSGFTGALTQRVRFLQPVWLRLGIIMGVLPAVLHTTEWVVHGMARTPARGRGFALSVSMTVVAELFNLYAMRKGTLLAGHEGLSLWQDMLRMPRIVVGFVASPFVAVGKRVAGRR